MSNTVLAKTLEFVGESIEAGTSAFFGTPRFVWLIPVVLVLAILVLFISPIGWVTEKPVQEIIAPTVIALAACVVGYFHYKQRSTLSLMLTCFVWALFLRELHLPLTNSGFYFAIVILAGWAVVERELLRGWLQNKNIAILLPAAFWTYIVTKIFDRQLDSVCIGYCRSRRRAHKKQEPPCLAASLLAGHGLLFQH